MQGATDSPFKVSLTDFNGPIDLLLHLVKSRELEIERVSLAQVTEQYLEVVEGIKDLDLEVASEYLVVAATLLSIKACALLAERSQFENELEENMPDPHRELLQMLRDAQVFKEGAAILNDRDILGINVFKPKASLDQIEAPEPTYMSHDVMLLGQAFRKLLERSGKDQNLMRIEVDTSTVVERMVRILDSLKAAGAALPFSALIPDTTSRSSLIGSFVALLELTKRRAIVIRQEDSFQEIFIALSGEEMSSFGLVSEFDNPDLQKVGNATN